MLKISHGALRFLGTAWGFLVLGWGSMIWHSSLLGRAFLAVVVPHALINATLMLCLQADSLAACRVTRMQGAQKKGP